MQVINLEFYREFVFIDDEAVKIVFYPKFDFANLMAKEKYEIGTGQPVLGYLGNHSDTSTYPIQSMAYFEKMQLTFYCPFHFESFPFDSHECNVTYTDYYHSSDQLKFASAKVKYQDIQTVASDGPNGGIIIKETPLPFEFELKSLNTFDKNSKSYTGMVINMKRKSSRVPLSGYYYPTTAFALLSMISFLINPDVVSILLYIFIAINIKYNQ